MSSTSGVPGDGLDREMRVWTSPRPCLQELTVWSNCALRQTRHCKKHRWRITDCGWNCSWNTGRWAPVGRNKRKWHSGDISRVELTRVREYEEEKWGRLLDVFKWLTRSVLVTTIIWGSARGRRAGFAPDIFKLRKKYSLSEEETGFCFIHINIHVFQAGESKIGWKHHAISYFPYSKIASKIHNRFFHFLVRPQEDWSSI